MSRKPVVAHQIVEILGKSHSLSVPALIEELSDRNTKVNKTSVYRALEKLEKNGTVCKEMFSESEVVYELREDHHDHLVCQRCGIVKTIPCETTTPRTVHGFSIDHHHTTFFGVCQTCATQEK